MRVPRQKRDSTRIEEQDLTPTGIGTLLDQGAVITGPGSDTHDTYFFREGALYVYCIDPQFGKDEKQFVTCAATREGLCELLCIACFYGHSWRSRL